ncbi:Hypothetical protein ORPV_441 [Orpheovirus IHUMI-LCC2]|uniref:Uncharacterized protein n=1 Tax=Orpheovirus IHUMI-LCC2 TaxID=2023057 RepID=A0A2I2L468_9VIRU|nr:Hypothetical protein ORPV_441 [Orpheovirus IHUMI-LCC2]SNW62345.1 Hypothetical protein ORPV_441 [Orpheovirus IHUMI-LCC2]
MAFLMDKLFSHGRNLYINNIKHKLGETNTEVKIENRKVVVEKDNKLGSYNLYILKPSRLIFWNYGWSKEAEMIDISPPIHVNYCINKSINGNETLEFFLQAMNGSNIGSVSKNYTINK